MLLQFCTCDISPRVRQKQNKYPILFLTQGVSEIYPEMIDVRCQNTQIAMSFAQSENILVGVEGTEPPRFESHFIFRRGFALDVRARAFSSDAATVESLPF